MIDLAWLYKRRFWGIVALVGGSMRLFGYLKRGYGSSADERGQLLPGDSLILRPHTQTTHAIIIPASPNVIWPWLVQVGYHRGGWYIDAWWDRWLNENFWPRFVPQGDQPSFQPSANQILPEWQNLAIGEIVPDGPPGSACFKVTALDPQEALVLFSTTHIPYLTPQFLNDTPLEISGDFSWAFILRELPGGRTRLLLRMRGTIYPGLIRLLSSPMLILTDYLYTRQMLLGIRRRAMLRWDSAVSVSF